MAVTETRQFNPRWPRREDIDPSRTVLSYDRLSDTLYIHLNGPARPAVTVPSPAGEADDRDVVFFRVDPDTEEVVGVQIEDFLSHVIWDTPAYLDLLDAAALHGITAEEVARLRRSLGLGSDRQLTVAAMVDRFTVASA